MPVSKLAALFALAWLLLAASAALARIQNVIVIIADDMGYAAIGVHGP